MDFKEANIDGDLLVYQCGFACESSSYFLLGSDESMSDPINDIRTIKKLKSANDAIMKSINIIPESQAIEILSRKLEAIKGAVKAEKYNIFLSHKKREVNRRNWIAVQLPYKSDRGPKPFYYELFRDILINEHGAIVGEEGEADDWLGIYQKDNTVICSSDKDLLQVPGYHFNINTYTFDFASKLGELHLDTVTKGNRKEYKLSGNGFKWFCAQCVTGDRTDSIRGLPYFKTSELVERLSPAKTEQEAWETVKDIYLKSSLDRLDIYRLGKSGLSPDEIKSSYLAQMSKLVWVARDEKSMYTPNIDGVPLEYNI